MSIHLEKLLMRSLAIDLETFSTTNLKTSGVYPYVADPGFDLLLFGYAVDGGDVQVVDLARGDKLPARLTLPRQSTRPLSS